MNGYHHLDQFRQEISTIYLGRSDDEIEGQRPKTVHKTFSVDQDSVTQKAYNAIEQGVLLADNDSVAGAMAQAQQAANSLWTFRESDVLANCNWDRIKSPKLKLLQGLLEDELKDVPTICYSQMETTVSLYCQELQEYEPVRITGKESGGNRAVSQHLFMSGKTNLIFITDAGGEALNLHRAQAVVFISRPWSPGKYIQVVGRARRFGSVHEFVQVIHLTCLDTVDEFVDAMLGTKWGAVEDICRGRGSLMPEQELLPLEIAEYVRNQRRKDRHGIAS